MGGGKIRRSSPQRGPGAEPRWVEVPKKMNNFTVIAGEFLRILRVTAKHFTSISLWFVLNFYNAAVLQ